MKKIRLAILLLASGAVGIRAGAQCCAEVELSATVTRCAGSPYVFTPSVILPGGLIAQTYSWTGTPGVSPSSGSGLPPLTTITPPSGTACSNVAYPYTLTVTALSGQEVTNGNFNLGNTGFTSTFAYQSSPAAVGQSNYTICSNANMVTGFVSPPSSFADHTGGGNMYIGFGNPNVSTAWEETLPVCTGASYSFQFWLAYIHNSSAGIVPLSSSAPTFVITIADAGSGSPHTYTYNPSTPPLTATYDAWQQVTIPYTPGIGAAGTATVSITESGRFVFALDDISFLGSMNCTASGSMTMDVHYPGISGAASLCVGTTTTLTGCIGSGTWSSSNTAVATVSASGVVTGISAGTSVISFDDASGCTATKTITVNPLPVISGRDTACVGEPFTLTTTGASYWSCTGDLTNLTGSGATTTGSFNGGGATGSGTVTVTLAATGCTSSKSITVIGLPPAPVGPSSVCGGSWTTWTNSISGDWSSSSGLYLDNGGPSSSTDAYAYGPGASTETVTFTDPTTGCYSSSTITIYADPTSTIPEEYLCIGSTLTLTDGPSGSWSSAAPTIANINASTGVVTGIASGSTTITYTTTHGCTTAGTVNVYNCSVSDPSLIGNTIICAGSYETLIFPDGVATGGTWHSSNTGIGTIASSGSNTGIFTAVSSGTVTITYTPPSAPPWSISITVYPVVTACVTSSEPPGDFIFTSGCGTIYYSMYSSADSLLGTGSTASGTYSYSTISASLPVPDELVYVCITGVDCICYSPSDCCASINAGGGRYAADGTNTTGAIIQGILPQSALSIAPNPNNGTFILSGTTNNTKLKTATIQIVDMLGKVVYSDVAVIDNNTVNKNISIGNNVANGIYFVLLKNDDINTSLRFVLTR